MMGTRAAAFAGKISNLRESILRIQNGAMPQPTCIDLANIMKYFSQVLQDFKDFKDIENIPLYAHEKRDKLQLIKTLPNFDYSGLYKTLGQLVDILPLIPSSSNGLDQLGSNLLMLFKCLVPFLDQANMETMPLLVTTLFMSLPQILHKDILDTLCFNLLPFTIDQQQKTNALIMRNAKKNHQQQEQSRRASIAKKRATSTQNHHQQQQQQRKPVHCVVLIEDPNENSYSTNNNDNKSPLSQSKADESGLDQDLGISLSDNISTTTMIRGQQQQHIQQDSRSQDSNEVSSDDDEYAILSVTSILFIAFHYIVEPMHHSQLVECMMKLKSNVFEDLLYIIAYGTTRARCPAVELLFRYWPDICPSQQDRKNNTQAGGKLKHVPWQPTKCQNKNCSFTNLSDDEAVKMCLDFKVSITLSNLPPPMLICLECVDSIYKQQHELGFGGGVNECDENNNENNIDTIKPSREDTCANSASIQAHIDEYSSKFIDLLLPMEKISKHCENKKCKSTNKSAIGTCFDIECSNYNCKRPIRYCKTCLCSIHEPNESNNYDVTLQTHIYHSSLNINIMDNEDSINNFVEAIISLLKEAAPADRPPKDSERHLRSLMGPTSQFNIDNKDMNIATEEKQLISQYGIWLMTGLCKRVDKISDELLGRLLGMLFQWFHFTACLPDDQAGSALEKLKGECIKGWIMGVKNQRLEVFISCLLPHPIDCSKIGGHWEVWPDTAHQIKEGFKRLLCLVPYDIITDDIWDEIMPYWMECFRHEVPENELSELKILLSKVFDPELSPLGFETKQMYNFISSRFEDSSNTNQEQTLYWLQIITMLEIPIPIDFLFQMLKSGVKSLAIIRANELNKIRIANRLADLDKLPTGDDEENEDDDQDRQNDYSTSTSGHSSSESFSSSSGDEEEDDEHKEEEGLEGKSTKQKHHRRRHERHQSHHHDDSSTSLTCMSIHEDDVLASPITPPTQQPTAAQDQLAVGAMSVLTAIGQPSTVAEPSVSRPMTQQEKQALARAAFSARILAHASMLDAAQNQNSSTTTVPNTSSSCSFSTSSANSTLANPNGAGLGGSTTTSLSSAMGSSTETIRPRLTGNNTSNVVSSLAPVTTHTRPLKSTTSSISSDHHDHKEQKQFAKQDVRLNTKPIRKHKHHHDHHHKHSKQQTSYSPNAVPDISRTKVKTTTTTTTNSCSSMGNNKPKLKLQLSSMEEYLMNKVDNNLICYILMLDILLKQLDLQEISSHRGLDGREAQQAIELLNTIISTPWIGKHTCCDSLPYFNHTTGSPTSTSQKQNSTMPPTATSKGSSSSTAAASTATSNNNKTSMSKQQQQQQQQAEDAATILSNNVHSFSHCAQGFEHEDSFETCVFCEIISTFHQLGMFLIEYFSPVIEVSICEVSQDAANGEFDGKPDYSRIGLNHLDPSPSPRPMQTPAGANEHTEFSFNAHQQQLFHQQQQQDPSSPFSPSYFGPSLKTEVLDKLPKELQLTYNLLVQFHHYQTPDIVSQLLQMIKLISLHSQVLSKAAKNNPEFITWCQHNMLVNKLWSLCQLESSEIARTCVPLLLHCITLPWGVRLFRDLVEREFNSENWLSRFRAVERVVTIAYFCEPSTIKNSTLLQSSMASAFCYVVRCLDDIEAIVAQRALVSLEMMKTSSLKLLLWCLEVQFDYIIIDRPMILRSVFQLYNHLKDRRFLTWEFFLNRFDTLFLEAQIYLQKTGEIPSFTMQDLKNTNTKSEIYQKKIIRAREALQETHHLRSLSIRFNEKQFSSCQQQQQPQTSKSSSDFGVGPNSTNKQQLTHDELQGQLKQSMKLQKQMQQSQQSSSTDQSTPDAAGEHAHLSLKSRLGVGVSLDDSSLKTLPTPTAGDKTRRDMSPLRKVMQHGRSTSSRYQSIAFLTSQSMVNRKNSKFMANLAMQSVPPMMNLPEKLHQHLPNSFVDDGSKLNEIAQENHVFGVVHRVCDEDCDANHSLVFLLMNFFSKPDPSHPQTVKTLNRNHQIVLRHLSILMGYSVARKNFLIPATNLRLLPVFNAFLTSLPKVLDFNYSLGTILLDTCLPVLIYCPAPEDVQYDSVKTPNYSLWLLNPLMRQSWLMSVLAFLYKYQFGQPHLRDYVHMLMWIVVNTLESHLNCNSLDSHLALENRLLKNNPRVDSTAAENFDESTNKNAPVPSTSKGVVNQSTAIHNQETLPLSATQLQQSAALSEPSPGPKSTGSGLSAKQLKLLGMEAATSQGAATEGRDKNSSKNSAKVSLVDGKPSTVLIAADEKKPPKVSTSTASTKALIKADTSDSLNVKAKLFQRKIEAPKGGSGSKKIGSSSANRLNTDCLIEISAPGTGNELANQSQNKSTCPESATLKSVVVVPNESTAQISTTNTSDERLLPIGIHTTTLANKTRSAHDLPAAERLLPIGGTPLSSTLAVTTSTNVATEIVSSNGTLKQGQVIDRVTGVSDSKKSLIIEGEKSAASINSELVAGASTICGSQPSTSQKSIIPDSQPKTTTVNDQNPATILTGSKNKTQDSITTATENSTSTTETPPVTVTSEPCKSNKRNRFGGTSIGLKSTFTEGNPTNDSTTPTSVEGTRQSLTVSGTNHSAGASASAKASTSSSLTGGISVVVGGRKGKGAKTVVTKEYVPPKQVNTLQPSFSSPSLLNEQLAQINRHSYVQEFSDKELSMCLVILETFIHHEPSMAAHMLPNILRLVARYSLATQDLGQSGSNVHLVGGSMFVARQFIRVALHDLMENNIFHQIFTSHFTGYEFYKSMATALADFTDLNQLAPLSKLFEDLNKQKNLPQATSLMTILENVATYFECIIAESSTHSQATWTSFITNWENFLRKLILALPRYSGTTITTTTSTGKSDGTSSMAHVNTSSSGHHQQTSTGGGGSGGGNMASGGLSNVNSTNQFLSTNRGNVGTGGAGGGLPIGSSPQDTANMNSANAIPSSCSMIMTPIMRIILSTSKIPHLASCKTIVDPYSKIVSYTVLNSQFKYEHLLEINHNFCRLCSRDREKYLIQRTIAYELVQVLKFRFFILEENLLILLLFILQDVGGTLSHVVVNDGLKIDKMTLNQAKTYVTGVSECLRQYIGDLLEFITDVHAISRINDNLIGSQPSSINRDSFGGHVKTAVSQYLALEMGLSNGTDNRAVLRYLPWLYTSPSLQQGPREFIECVSHIRQLSWIILGSLQHSTLMKDQKQNQFAGQYGNSNASGGLGLVVGGSSSTATAAAAGGSGGGGLGSGSGGAGVTTSGGGSGGGGVGTGSVTIGGVTSSAGTSNTTGNSTTMPTPTSGAYHQQSHSANCQPIPIEKNGNVAEHVQVILAGFAEQSKESVLHMSGLFHAFLLCQLWTVYCENICSLHSPQSEQYQFCQSTLDDFWAKITPGVLRLVGHSRVMSEMVSTHFLQLIESLIESNSSILIRYLPMWNPIFYSYKRKNKSGNLAIRLQKCIEWQPPDLNEQDSEQSNKRLINWLEKVQYKMSHIEIQSSQAAPFYLT